MPGYSLWLSMEQGLCPVTSWNEALLLWNGRGLICMGASCVCYLLSGPEKGPWLTYSLPTFYPWTKPKSLLPVFVFRAEVFNFVFPCAQLRVIRTSKQKGSFSKPFFGVCVNSFLMMTWVLLCSSGRNHPKCNWALIWYREDHVHSVWAHIPHPGRRWAEDGEWAWSWA